MVQFVLASGAAVPLNAQVTLNGQPQGIVGYDGVAWLTGLAAENTVGIVMDDATCQAQLHIGELVPGAQIGPVTCVAIATPPSGSPSPK
jgi:outer membrane usher protein FimD/PapC